MFSGNSMYSGPAVTWIAQVSVLPLTVETVIVASPSWTALTLPFASTVATPVSLEAKSTAATAPSSTRAVSFAEWPCPRVSSCWSSLTLCGGAVTVTVQFAPFPLYVQTETVVVPGPFAVTTPSGETSAIVGSGL